MAIYELILAMNPLDMPGNRILLPDAYNPEVVENPPYQDVIERARMDIMQAKGLLDTIETQNPISAPTPFEYNAVANPLFNKRTTNSLGLDYNAFNNVNLQSQQPQMMDIKDVQDYYTWQNYASAAVEPPTDGWSYPPLAKRPRTDYFN